MSNKDNHQIRVDDSGVRIRIPSDQRTQDVTRKRIRAFLAHDHVTIFDQRLTDTDYFAEYSSIQNEDPIDPWETSGHRHRGIYILRGWQFKPPPTYTETTHEAWRRHTIAIVHAHYPGERMRHVFTVLPRREVSISTNDWFMSQLKLHELSEIERGAMEQQPPQAIGASNDKRMTDYQDGMILRMVVSTALAILGVVVAGYCTAYGPQEYALPSFTLGIGGLLAAALEGSKWLHERQTA